MYPFFYDPTLNGDHIKALPRRVSVAGVLHGVVGELLAARSSLIIDVDIKKL